MQPTAPARAPAAAQAGAGACDGECDVSLTSGGDVSVEDRVRAEVSEEEVF